MPGVVDESKKPYGTKFKQQSLRAIRPTYTPKLVGGIMVLTGALFVILGMVAKGSSAAVKEASVEYSGMSDCQIQDSGPASTCTVTVKAADSMEAPVLVYYELTKVYQNHRRYVKSYDKKQMIGDTSWTGAKQKSCEPLTHAGDKILHPCGLIANSLFNDKILIASDHSMKYDGIAWTADDEKYFQPAGFKFKEENAIGAACSADGGECSDKMCEMAGYPSGCGGWSCPEGEEDYYGCEKGTSYVYFYPNEDTYQYLYKTYPEVVSPIMGVHTERFQVWMRNQALPTFRKLYGFINSPIAAGDEVSFTVEANFDSAVFGGTKSIVLSTDGSFGGKNGFLGTCFLAVGVLCALAGMAIAGKGASAKPLGDLSLLK